MTDLGDGEWHNYGLLREPYLDPLTGEKYGQQITSLVDYIPVQQMILDPSGAVVRVHDGEEIPNYQDLLPHRFDADGNEIGWAEDEQL